MNFLYAAYSAVWIIHGAYLVLLVRRYSRIKREMQDLRKK
jgi:CcmD family protein